MDETGSRPPALADVAQVHRSFVTPEAGDVFADEPEEYAIEGSIGAGGMGAVLRAKSSRLGRAVALKVIIEDRADLRRRFEYEAQVTARLQHPAIVPVYGFGRGKNGQPFYAMKQVTGEPLDRVIAKADTFAKRIALLPNLIAVTEAIAYAHSQRVIHRDLKPANILAGAFGETVVIDWGLAKDLSRDDDDDDSVESASPYRVSGDATAVGKVMGTPAFMPLEQARGDAIDERADVYALGAILYHLIAGAPPYTRTGETGVPWETVLARVLDAPPKPLAEIQPETPPDLLAIVTRAMARRADARYATASELAEDLRRFQTGQLVGAHRYSAWQLVGRFVRRHRAAVTVGAVLVAVLAVVSAVSIQRIRTERTAAETQRTAAVASRGDVEDLMGFMLGDLKDKLEPVGKLAILDSVAQRAVAYYDRHPEATSEADRRKRALAYMNAGSVIQAQGNLGGALTAYQRALAIRESLAFSPGNGNDMVDAADSHYLVGDVLDYRGDRPGAMAEYRQGFSLASIAAAAPGAPAVAKFMVSRGYNELAEQAINQGELELAKASLAKALALQRPLVAAEPKTIRWRRSLVVSLAKLGLVHSMNLELTVAVTVLNEAVAESDLLVTLEPTSLELARRAALVRQILGTVQTKLGEPAAAVLTLRAAVATCDRLVQIDPANTEWARTGMAMRTDLATALANTGDNVGAEAELRSGISSTALLVEHDPANAQWRHDLASLHHALAARLLSGTHDMKGALAELAIAIPLREAVVKQDPANVNYQRNLASDHTLAGDVLSQLPDESSVRAAIPHYEAALAVYRDLIAREPGNADFARIMAFGLYGLGDTYARLGDPKALPMLADARTRWADLAKRDPANPDPPTQLVWIALSVAIAQLHDDPTGAQSNATIDAAEVALRELQAKATKTAQLTAVQDELNALRAEVAQQAKRSP